MSLTKLNFCDVRIVPLTEKKRKLCWLIPTVFRRGSVSGFSPCHWLTGWPKFKTRHWLSHAFFLHPFWLVDIIRLSLIGIWTCFQRHSALGLPCSVYVLSCTLFIFYIRIEIENSIRIIIQWNFLFDRFQFFVIKS